MFGGANATGPNDETWVLEPDGWAPLDIGSSPEGRLNHVLGYDRLNSRAVLSGGKNISFATLGDTWFFKNGSWLPALAGELKRSDATLAYDADQQVLRMFAGLDGNNVRRNTYYTLVDDNWRLESNGVSVSGRIGSAMTYDQEQQAMVVFGGETSTKEKLDDTWLVYGTTWSPGPSAARPLPRRRQATTYDTARGRTVLFGGERSISQIYRDTWFLRGNSWIQGPLGPPRNGASLVYDTPRERVLLIGGLSGQDQYENDIWLLQDDSWSRVTQLEGELPGIADHGAAYDAKHDRVVVFGGRTASGTISNTWFLREDRWTEGPSAPDTLSARSRHTLAYDAKNERMVMFGGQLSGGGWLNDTWFLDETGWEAGPPPPSSLADGHHQLVYDAKLGQMVLFGRTGAWTLDSDQWIFFATSPSGPATRVGPGIVYDTKIGRTVLAGGVDSTLSTVDDTWTFQFKNRFSPEETCDATAEAVDDDDDGLTGCFDLDCWAYCTPTCSPYMSCSETQK